MSACTEILHAARQEGHDSVRFDLPSQRALARGTQLGIVRNVPQIPQLKLDTS